MPSLLMTALTPSSSLTIKSQHGHHLMLSSLPSINTSTIAAIR